MKLPVFHVGKYRCWNDSEGTWLENDQIVFRIEPGYISQIIEMLTRMQNAMKYTPDAQVRSTREVKR